MDMLSLYLSLANVVHLKLFAVYKQIWKKLCVEFTMKNHTDPVKTTVGKFLRNCSNIRIDTEQHGTPLQYSCLKNPMDGGAWWAAVHGVTKSRTRLSDFTFTFSLSCIGEGNGNPLQCSCLENPRDGEPGGLTSMGSHRVGRD